MTPTRLLNDKAPVTYFATAFLLSLFALIAYQFDDQLTQFLKNDVWKLFGKKAVPGDIRKAIELSEVFAHGFGVSTILLVTFCVAIHRRQVLWVAIVATAISGTVANVAKVAVVRTRPYAAGLQVEGHTISGSATITDPQVVKASFWDTRQRSFPSGHTATAWGLAIGLSWAFPRGRVPFALLALLASYQRIVSHAHFPSDVFAGAAIAFGCTGLLLLLPKVRETLRNNNLD